MKWKMAILCIGLATLNAGCGTIRSCAYVFFKQDQAAREIVGKIHERQTAHATWEEARTIRPEHNNVPEYAEDFRKGRVEHPVVVRTKNQPAPSSLRTRVAHPAPTRARAASAPPADSTNIPEQEMLLPESDPPSGQPPKALDTPAPAKNQPSLTGGKGYLPPEAKLAPNIITADHKQVVPEYAKDPPPADGPSPAAEGGEHATAAKPAPPPKVSYLAAIARFERRYRDFQAQHGWWFCPLWTAGLVSAIWLVWRRPAARSQPSSRREHGWTDRETVERALATVTTLFPARARLDQCLGELLVGLGRVPGVAGPNKIDKRDEVVE